MFLVLYRASRSLRCFTSMLPQYLVSISPPPLQFISHPYLSQRRRLYLMKGLTTWFTRPPPPKPGLVSRESLGIPPRPVSPPGSAPPAFGLDAETASTYPVNGIPEDLARGSLSCEALYLVPQTLYKLHPDFDALVAGVLRADVSGCVVFIRAFETVTTEGLVGRMSKALLAAGVGFERVIFIRRCVPWVCTLIFTVHVAYD